MQLLPLADNTDDPTQQKARQIPLAEHHPQFEAALARLRQQSRDRGVTEPVRQADSLGAWFEAD